MRGDAFFSQVASQPPFSRMHPQMAAFFKGYLTHEKVTPFGDRFVLNTHFPPFPSPAFDQLAAQFDQIGDSTERHLHSVTFAVTNRCPYRCWHCYNAGRCQQDLPLDKLREVAAQLQDLGTVMVSLSGGEPLVRDDLEEIARTFDERTCLTLNTTGYHLTPERARSLRDSGLFAVGISLDSVDPDEHDRLRGHPGAFRTAVDALEITGESGLYPYVVAVATRQFLEPERFQEYVDFAARSGAREIHLLEPCPTGRLAGRSDILLDAPHRQRILDYQREFAQRDDLPVLSSFTYLESAELFGCGAGLTHLYIDGSGEVCPCNLVPLSFGNVAREPLAEILQRMGCHFCRPRTGCVGQVINRHIPEGPLPTPPEVSRRLCDQHLPRKHPVPRFFQIRAAARGDVGQQELRAAYDQVHGSYDEFWVSEAGKPVVDLIGRIDFTGIERILEAGCGTGYGTALLTERIPKEGELIAVDLSPGMLQEARRRVGNPPGIHFVAGDALAELEATSDLDLIFTTWVLGYIPLVPFFRAAEKALKPGGSLAFVVHRENSPREPLDIFAKLVAHDPAVLLKRVEFDFPRNGQHIRDELEKAGFHVEQVWEGEVVFSYDNPEQVLEHLLKSGAGTAFYDAIDPARRNSLTQEFIQILAARHPAANSLPVIHDYVAGIATKA